MKEYKPDEKYKRFVLKTVEHLRPALNLHNWSVYVHFVPYIANHKHIQSFTRDGASAEMKSDHVYMTIDISVSKKMEKKLLSGRVNDVREDLCHELIHQFLDAYYDAAIDKKLTQRRLTNVDENTTQILTMVLMKHIQFK